MKNIHEEDVNKKKWNELAKIHYEAYGIEKLFHKKTMLTQIELGELGNLEGKELLHLQCHIGTDSLSLEIEGANVTGVDFSETSLEYANKLRDDLKLKANFLLGNVLDLDNVLHRKFDIIYTSKGVLCWINDIKKWAKTIAKF